MFEMLLPSTCIISLKSQKFKDEKDLKTEKYYETKYKLEKIPEAKLVEWANIMPRENESLDNTPENIFIPKNKPLLKKVPKPEGSD